MDQAVIKFRKQHKQLPVDRETIDKLVKTFYSELRSGTVSNNIIDDTENENRLKAGADTDMHSQLQMKERKVRSLTAEVDKLNNRMKQVGGLDGQLCIDEC